MVKQHDIGKFIVDRYKEFQLFQDKLLFSVDHEKEIYSVSRPVTGMKNCLVFINKDDFDLTEIWSTSKDCLFLIQDSNQLPSNYAMCDNSFIVVPDSRFHFAEVVTHFGLTQVWLSPDCSNVTENLSNYKAGVNFKVHHTSLIGNDDFCPIQSPYDDRIIMFPQLGFVEIGNNVTVMGYSMINRGALWNTVVGDNTKIDVYCQVGHNSIIENNVIIAAGSIIGGSSHIGHHTFIGMGVTIRNGTKIGHHCTIGQGANVVKDVPDYAIVVGNPGKVIGFNNEDFNVSDVPKR